MNEEKMRADFETWIPGDYLGKSVEREYQGFKLGIATAIKRCAEKCEELDSHPDHLHPSDCAEAIRMIYEE